MVLGTILSWDVSLTNRLGVCASTESSWGQFRPLMKLLELSCHGLVWIPGTAVAVLLSHRPVMQEKLLNLFIGLLIDIVIVTMFKTTVRRKRPAHNKEDMLATVSIDRFSFPSGHTTRAAMVAYFFSVQFLSGDNVLMTAFIIWAVVVSLSRVILGRHHVLDVIAGLLIGTAQYWIIEMVWLPEETCINLLQPIQEELHL